MIRAAILTAALCVSPTVAQDAPPKLEPVFLDDFSKDTRADYKFTGDATWDKGKLTLSEGASIGRAINGGRWAEVALRLQPVELTKDQPLSELRVWFRMEGATDCYVRLRQKLEGGKTVCSIALVDTGEMDGKPVEEVVREVALGPNDVRDARLVYREGLVRAAVSGRDLFAGYIENGTATVRSVAVSSLHTASSLQSFAAAEHGQASYTDSEMRQLAQADADHQKALRLYLDGKPEESTVLARRVLAVRKSVLGEQHSLYASSLQNLAVLLRSVRDYSQAEPLYRQSIEIEKSVLGEQHPTYATSLHNLAGLYEVMSDYARAEPLYKQAREIRKAVLGEKHPEYATSLTDLARLYEIMSDYARAEPLYKRARDIRRSVLGEKHPEYANSLDDLADLYVRMGDPSRAEPLFRQCIEIKKSVLGDKDPSYARSLNNLAELYREMGDYAGAEPLSKQALSINKSAYGEQHHSYVTSLNNLALVYVGQGEYSLAARLLKQSCDIGRSVFGEQHPRYAHGLNNLAALYKMMGQYERAELLHWQCIRIKKDTLGEQHPQYALSLHNLARLYQDMGDYSRAEPLYRQSIEIEKSGLGEQHPSYAASLHSLAGLYHDMGDYDRAERLYAQSMEIVQSILGEQHPDYARGLNDLAMLYREQGKDSRAEALLKQSRDIRKSVLGKDHPQYAASLNNLAGLYHDMGDYSRAKPLYVECTEIEKSVLGEQHPSYGGSLNNLARLYQDMGDYDRAEPLYERAMQIVKAAVGEQHPNYARSLQNLAGLYEQLGDLTRAGTLHRQALTIQRNHLNANATVQSARQQSRNQEQLRVYLDRRLASTVDLPEPRASEVAADVWQWKGAVTERQQAYRRVAGDRTLAPLFADLQSVTQKLSVESGRIPEAPPKSAPDKEQEAFQQKREAWDTRVTELTDQREYLEQQIAAGSESFRRLRDPLTPTTLSSLLPDATAFIDFLEYSHYSLNRDDPGRLLSQPRFLAVIIRGDGSVKLLTFNAAIATAITAFRSPLTQNGGTGQPDPKAARTLRAELWLPLEKHLDGIETVIISPDTSLGTLPFAALPGKVDGSYLLEEYRFVSLPLAGMLRSLFDEDSPRPQPKKGLLVLGDVDYDANSLVAKAETKQGSRPAWMRRAAPRSDEDGWQSLLGFSEELAIVERAFRKKFDDAAVTTLDGDRATEAEFIKHASNHYNLHLITHGFFADPEFESVGAVNHDEQDRVGSSTRTRLAASQTINQYLPGLLSGVVLAGANNPPPADDPNADGILTASEIETLNLNGVDLVVLSACETGLGKTAGGEGLTGLQRAFHIAGARSCIATLWKVDDKATQEVMSRFYRNYWEKGESKIDALRNAQLEVLRSPRLVRGDVRQLNPTKPGDTPKMRTPPGFWAAFTLSGDWR